MIAAIFSLLAERYDDKANWLGIGTLIGAGTHRVDPIRDNGVSRLCDGSLQLNPATTVFRAELIGNLRNGAEEI